MLFVAPYVGFHGRPTDQLLDSLQITRYQSSKAALSFADYVAGSHSRLGDVEQLLLNGNSSNSTLGRLFLAN